MNSQYNINQLTSCSISEPLDIDGKVWYTDYSNIDVENLTLKESYEVVRD